MRKSGKRKMTNEENWEARAKTAEAKYKSLKKKTKDKLVVLEQREKIDTRTNILRVSLGLNTGLISGLLVYFFIVARSC